MHQCLKIQIMVLDAYQNGDFCANVHPRTRDTGSGIWGAEWTFDMTLNEETGNYELDIPMIQWSSLLLLSN